MTKDKPYFSLEGLAFQTPGDPVEITVNTRAAMAVLEAIARKREPPSDPMVALAYLEDAYPYLEPECDAFRIALGLRDITDEDYRQRLAIRAYNTLADVLSGRGRR